MVEKNEGLPQALLGSYNDRAVHLHASSIGISSSFNLLSLSHVIFIIQRFFKFFL